MPPGNLPLWPRKCVDFRVGPSPSGEGPGSLRGLITNIGTRPIVPIVLCARVPLLHWGGGNHTPRHFLAAIVGGLILVGLLQFVAIAPMNASAQTATSFSFNLLGPNTAKAPADAPMFAGFTLKVTGSGSFDTAAPTITGGGSWWVIDPNGMVVDRGTWVATTYVSFDSYGGPSSGLQGGLLRLLVTATSSVTGQVFGPLPSTISCVVNAPPGAPPEGITSGVFSQSTGGFTLFHM